MVTIRSIGEVNFDSGNWTSGGNDDPFCKLTKNYGDWTKKILVSYRLQASYLRVMRNFSQPWSELN